MKNNPLESKSFTVRETFLMAILEVGLTSDDLLRMVNELNEKTCTLQNFDDTLEVLQKVNKKTYGKKVKPDDLIQKSISLLSDDHLEEIKQSTMSNSDRLEIAYQEYCKGNGQISKDEYFGLLLKVKSP